MQDAESCATMSELRALIDRIDTDLVALLAARQACIDRAVVLKQGEALPARIPHRVDEVLDRVRRASEARGLDPALSDVLWRTMIEWAIAREARVLGDDT